MDKKPWLSKTMWFGLLTALSPWLAALVNFDLAAWLIANTGLAASIWGGLAIAIRFITKDKIKLLD